MITRRRCWIEVLPSLRDFEFLVGDVPSHKWLGYFHEGGRREWGLYESAIGKKFSRLQLLTIAGLLSGTQRAEHPDHAPDLNFKKAKAESHSAQKELI